ncbi:hypothetical protein, partial [Pseudactinotalea sp.]|uniref:hypothetical protein n=1 Tax=Pseudactinotalea sp. TaxID=1926260 RepID=UPI003B3A73B1
IGLRDNPTTDAVEVDAAGAARTPDPGGAAAGPAAPDSAAVATGSVDVDAATAPDATADGVAHEHDSSESAEPASEEAACGDADPGEPPPGWEDSCRSWVDDVPATEMGPVAWFDVLAPSSHLMAELEKLPADLVDDDYDSVEIVAHWARLSAYCAAKQREAAAALARRELMAGGLANLEHLDITVSQPNIAGDELAIRLGIGKRAAAGLMKAGQAMAGIAIPTADALAAGEIDAVKADISALGLDGLSPDAALEVQDLVLSKAGHLPSGSVRRELAAARAKVEPSRFEERCAQAAKARRFDRPRVLPDGMASIYAIMPAVGANQIYRAADAAARSSKSAGDERTLDQLRADALALMGTAAIDSGWIGSPPEHSGNGDHARPEPRTGEEPAQRHGADPGRTLSSAGHGSDRTAPPPPAPISGPAPLPVADRPPDGVPRFSGDPAPALTPSGYPAEPSRPDPPDPRTQRTARADRLSRDTAPPDSAAPRSSPPNSDPTGIAPMHSHPMANHPPHTAPPHSGPPGSVVDAGSAAGTAPVGMDPQDAATWTAAGAGVCPTPHVGMRVGQIGGKSAHIRVVVPLTSLIDSNDPAHLEGYGPIPASTARALAAGGPWARMVTDPVDRSVIELTTDKYEPPAAMAALVRAARPECASPVCSVPSDSCDLHHRVPWPAGATSARQLDPGCRRDHLLVTHAGWSYDLHLDGSHTWTTPTGHVYIEDSDGRLTILVRDPITPVRRWLPTENDLPPF